jgi:aspartate/methionine/tyrosine aminotransferase
MRRQDYTSIGTGKLSQFIAEAALEPRNRQRLLDRGRKLLSTNAQVLDKWISQHAQWISYRRPQAGAIAFLRYSIPLSSEEFSVLLREEESVFVVAGSWFGINQHIRVGIGGKTEELQEGLHRITAFLKRHA